MILNLTQHTASSEQLAAGVIDLPPETRKELAKLLTFDELPSHADIRERCGEIVALIQCLCTSVQGVHEIMIGGAPFLMGPLECALRGAGLDPVYAFSRRESAEDGSGRKVSVFRHLGFVRFGFGD